MYKIKTTRVPYDTQREYLGLEDTLNEIGDENIKMVLPVYYGGGEVGYTIIYKEKIND